MLGRLDPPLIGKVHTVPNARGVAISENPILNTPIPNIEKNIQKNFKSSILCWSMLFIHC